MIPHTVAGEQMVLDLKRYMKLEKVPIKYAMNDRQRQLLGPIERPNNRNLFLKRVLQENRNFHKEAAAVIRAWKIEGYRKRIIKKIRIIIRRDKVQ